MIGKFQGKKKDMVTRLTFLWGTAASRGQVGKPALTQGAWSWVGPSPSLSPSATFSSLALSLSS
jgi:hypothetical protein